MEPMDTVERIKSQRINSIFSKLESISSTEDVQIRPYLDSIGIENLKIHIAQHLRHNIANGSRLNALFFSVESIQNILCEDVIQSIVTFLPPKDIHCCITVLNKEFNQLLKKRATVHRLFYYHPMLRKLFNKSRWNGGYAIERREPAIKRDQWGRVYSKFDGSKIQYNIQNKYDTKTLNSCIGHDKLLETLIGHDLYICRLCQYFDLKIILRGEIGTGETDIDDCYTDCFEDLMVEIESVQCYYGSTWNVTNLNHSVNQRGLEDVEFVGHYRHYRWHHPIIPVLLIDVPDQNVRNTIEKCIGISKAKMSGNEGEDYAEELEKESIQELGMWF
eukprot:74243_1